MKVLLIISISTILSTTCNLGQRNVSEGKDSPLSLDSRQKAATETFTERYDGEYEVGMPGFRFQDTVNVASLGISGDGKQDVTDLINEAIKKSVFRNTALYFPPGVYIIGAPGISLSHSNIGLFGAQDGTTTFVPGENNSKALMQIASDVSHVENIDIRNLELRCTYKGHAVNYAILMINKGAKNVTIDSCRFTGIHKRFLQLANIDSFVISNCSFLNQGEPKKNTFYVAILDGRNIQFLNNLMRGYYQGLYVSPRTKVSDMAVRNNLFDGMWYLTQQFYKGESKTIEYTASSLYDYNFDFSNISKRDGSTKDIRGNLIRVLSSRGTGIATVIEHQLLDSQARFEEWGVIPGEIVEVGKYRGIISEVVSNSELLIEFWYNKETMALVDLSSDRFSYELFAIYLSYNIEEITTHRVSVKYWHDLNGQQKTPPTGSFWEFVKQLPVYALHMGPKTEGVLIQNNKFIRNHADQISFFGGGATIRDNDIRDGQDMGMTVWNKNNLGSAIFDNHISRPGTCGITVNGNDNEVYNNVIVGPLPTTNLLSPQTIGGIALVGGENNILTGNTIKIGPFGKSFKGVVLSKNIKDINVVEGNNIHFDKDGNSIYLFEDRNKRYNKWQY